MLQFLFWLFLLLGIYSYFLYPLLLMILVRRGATAADRAADNSADRVAGHATGHATAISLTMIVTAFNERARIRDKIENTLAIEYPGLEIIVASDCSTDETDQIVTEYAARGVKLVRAPERLGKENAQAWAIQAATGDVIVFSDVATQIPADALVKLAGYFADPKVGAVSSEDRFISGDGFVAGEGAYVKYEMWLRRMESALAGLVGLSGSFFAARKEVCAQWDIHSPSDFNTALNCARLGYRAITAADVLGFYKDLTDPAKEYQRKVRTVLRGISAIARHVDVLSYRHFGLFAFQVWSHKVMRWLVPWFLAALLLVNWLLVGTGWFYTLSLLAQLAFYGTAIAAHYRSDVKEHPVARIVYFFVQVNIAVVDACCRFLAGKRITVWQPSAR